MRAKNYEVYDIKNLKDMLYKSVEKWDGRTAFKEKRNGAYESITINKFFEDTRALGTELFSMGLSGKRIIVTGENCYNWAVSYMTVVCGLGVVVPVDKEINAEEIANIARISEVAAVIYSKNTAHKIEKLDQNVKRICFDELPSLIESGKEKLAAGESGYIDSEVDENVVAAILFTSGTTGVSKGVMLSHKNICFNLMEMCQMIYIGPDDTFLSVLPLHHAYECTCGFLCQIYRGSTIAYCEGLKYITRNMQEVKPTIILCVPLLIETMYTKIWNNIRKKGMEAKVKAAMKLSNALLKTGVDIRKKLFAEIHNTFGGELRLMISGGAAVDPKILKEMRALGILTVQGYGLTECAPLAAVNRDKFYCDSAAGLATPNAQLDICDVSEDGTGEIIFKGDNIMLGYYENKELTDEVIKDGWFYTGDIGYLDKKGFLHITGRKKNVIVTNNGKNIFPEELETYLGRSPYIKESVVVGVSSGDKLDSYDIVAMIVIDEERFDEEFGRGAYDKDKVNEVIKSAVDAVNLNVQSYKHINKFLIRDEEFSKNTSRKIKRIGLTEEATRLLSEEK